MTDRAPDPIDAHVGARIRQLRRRLRISQESVAKACGVTFQQTQKVEKAANRISASALWKVAKALSVPVGYFFEGLDDAPEDRAPDDWAARAFADTDDGVGLLKIAMHIPKPILLAHLRLMQMEVGCITDLGTQIIAARMGEDEPPTGPI